MDLEFMSGKETMDEIVMKDEFIVLTKTMDLPEMRRNITSANIRWFLRNAQIRNKNHSNIEVAMEIAKKLLK